MMMMDNKNYFLGTPLPTYEYMQLPLAIILEKIIKQHDLKEKAVESWV